MYKKISRADEIFAKLPTIPQNEEEELKKMQRMNSYMEEVCRDYLYKNAMSELSAREVILNA